MQFFSKNKKRGKRGQVTIFVIIALVIIASALLFFVLRPKIKVEIRPLDPAAFIESCMKEETEKAVFLISQQGGSIAPSNYVLWKGQKVGYLCFTYEYYKGCVNQKPFLKKTVETEISFFVLPKLKECTIKLKKTLEKEGNIVEIKSVNINTFLQPKKILLKAEIPMTIKKGESIARYEIFETSLADPLYDLLFVSQNIVNEEAYYGDFDHLSVMLLHSDIDIEKERTDGNTIYTVKDKPSNKKFVFAVRSFASPPGLF